MIKLRGFHLFILLMKKARSCFQPLLLTSLLKRSLILSNLKFVYVFRVASGACIYVVFT